MKLTFDQKRLVKSRANRAKRIMQQVRICKIEGFVYIQGHSEPLNLKEFKQHLLKMRIFNMNRKEPDRLSAVRACDILKHGENSSWWRTRKSRDIENYIIRIERRCKS